MRQGMVWALALAAVLVASGCSAPPKATSVEPRETPAPAPAGPAAGDVLGRSDRFVIYLPRADESLRQIAARFLGAENQAWQIAEFNGITRPAAGQPVVVPLKPVNPIGVQVDQFQTVPILCYHRFSGTGAGSASVGGYAGKMVMSVANFAAQLDWLARNDYHVIRLSQLVAFLEGKRPLPKRSVVITFDDGYESMVRHALPLLRKYGFPATLFVYTDFIGAGDALSWAQLQELDASGLIDIQPHSKTHRNLLDRAAGESDAAYRQIVELETRAPRELLERRLGKPVRHYAYPFGDANETVLDVLQRQQYQLAVTVNPGGNAFFAQPLMLRRTMIYGDYDLEDFKLKLQTHRAIGSP
jgi:peptidoglycan/xylan/chitin deacetylase (PgdA/CDA1 family)